MKVIERTKSENYTGEFIKTHMSEKTLEQKFNDFKALLNISDFEPMKIKTLYVDGDEERVACVYTSPKDINKYIDTFSTVTDIKEIKVKGFIDKAKISILLNFAENYMQTKSDYTTSFKAKDIEKIISDFV